MIYLTFTHSRDIFKKDQFQNWVKIWFPNARFEGCESGQHYPTIKVKLPEFQKWQKFKYECERQKSRLVKIKGKFNIIEQLSLGVRDFENDLRNDPEN